MDNDTDFGNDYDGGSDDFDSSEIESGSERATNAEDTHDDQMGAVVELLRGNSEPADSLVASGKTGGMEAGTSYSTDSHGRREAGDAPSQGGEGLGEYSTDTIYSQDVKYQMQQAEERWNTAHAQVAQLDEMLQNNEITPEQHHSMSHDLGVMAGQARVAAMSARIQQLEHGQQRDAQFKDLESLGGDFSPERRGETMQSIVNFVTESGLDRAVLQGVETKDEVMFLHNAMKNAKRVEELEMQLAGKSQKLREANRALGNDRRKGQKSAQLGMKHDNHLEQVMDILSGINSKGGRRR